MANKTNILVLPAGSGLAIGAIKTLKRQKTFRVVSCDSDKMSPGLFLSDKGYLIPSFDEEDFQKSLEAVIKKEKIDIIIPALDTILLYFAELAPYFRQKGVKVLVSEPETIKITRDKWKTYELLKDVVDMPKSFISKEKIDIPLPLFLKPRDGSGSIDAVRIDSKEDLDYYFRKVKNPIIQEYLDGEEYTVDCLADMSGKSSILCAKIEAGRKSGISVKGKVIKSSEIDDIAKKVAKTIKFKGPFFFQLKEKEGKLKITEINTRLSGGMPLSVAAGPNIYDLSIKLFLGKKIGAIPKIKYGMCFTRFYEEIYFTEEKVDSKIKKI